MTFSEFERDLNNGVYDTIKMCLPLRTLLKTLDTFPQHRQELLDMFNYKMIDLITPSLWENN